MKTLMDRIEINPKILVGKPVVKGTRIPVYLIVNLMAQGYDYDRIIHEYPELTKQDIQAALAFAAKSVNYMEEPISTVHG